MGVTVHLTLGSVNSACTQLGRYNTLRLLNTSVNRGRDRLSATKNDFTVVNGFEVTSTIQYGNVFLGGPDSKEARGYTLVKGWRTCPQQATSVGDPDPEPHPHVFGPPGSGSFPFLTNLLRGLKYACKIKFLLKILAKLYF